MAIFDPYREDNERSLRWLESLSHAEYTAHLKKIGILDGRGNLAKKYRLPKEEPFRIGERVRLTVGLNEVVERVLEDRGPILSFGQRLIRVAFTTPDGGGGEIVIASNEVAREEAREAARSPRPTKKGGRPATARPGKSRPTSRRASKPTKPAKPKPASSVTRKRAAS